jgi:O6-methylguanine-DNA--protein-cysteine methyltransferase
MREAHANPVLGGTAGQLREYFAGERTRFDLDIAMEGTPFQKRVWNALRKHWTYTVADFVDAREDRLLANGIDV